MNVNDLDRQSIRNYGIHGALGLLMGAGIGAIITFFLLANVPFLSDYFASSDSTYFMIFIFNFIVFTVYGVYLGHVLDIKNELSKLGAIAGIFCGITAAFAVRVLNDMGGNNSFPASYILILGIAGLIFGVPKTRNMIFLAVSGVLGGTAGTGLYIFGQGVTYFLKDAFFFLAILILLLVSICAIGLAGASISIGMYVLSGTVFSRRDISLPLKIVQITGLGLIIVVLVFITMIFFSYADYASSSASIHITSDADEMTVYVPVLLDDTGNVLTMYEHPEITGDATAGIIMSEQGKVFRISGTGDIEITMLQSHGIQKGRQLEEVFNGFAVSTGNYTVNEDVQMTDVWIYSAGDVDDASISLNLDTGWGQMQSIRTERNIGPVEGWQMVRLSVRNMLYD
jgi:hypothetical protein